MPRQSWESQFCLAPVYKPPPPRISGGGRPQPAGQNDFSPANFAGETHFARIPRAKWEKNFAARPQLRAKISYDFFQKFTKKKKSRFFSPATSLNFRGVFVHVWFDVSKLFMFLRIWKYKANPDVVRKLDFAAIEWYKNKEL